MYVAARFVKTCCIVLPHGALLLSPGISLYILYYSLYLSNCVRPHKESQWTGALSEFEERLVIISMLLLCCGYTLERGGSEGRDTRDNHFYTACTGCRLW